MKKEWVTAALVIVWFVSVAQATQIADAVERNDGWMHINGAMFSSGIGGLSPVNGATFWATIEASSGNRGAWKLFNDTFTNGTLSVACSIGALTYSSFNFANIYLFADADENGVYSWAERIEEGTTKYIRPSPTSGKWQTWTRTYQITASTLTAGGQSVIGKKIGFLVIGGTGSSSEYDFAFDGLSIQSMPTDSVIEIDAICDKCKPAIAILDSSLRDHFKTQTALSDPQTLARGLRAVGRQVTMIDEQGLADLNPDQYPLVILPQGPWFPASAKDGFVRYLQAGGCFFSTGGYAFDQFYDDQGNVLPNFGPNLVKNGSFEDGVWGWKLVSQKEGVDCWVDEDQAVQGKQALQVILNNGQSNWAQVNSDPFNVTPEQMYTFHMAIHGGNLSGGVGAYGVIVFRDSSGVQVPIQAGKMYQSTGFVQAREIQDDGFWSVKAPGGAVTGQVRLLINGQGNAWFDDITVQADLRQRLNSHWGDEFPHILFVKETQIPIFDVSNPLRYIESVAVAPDQAVLRPVEMPELKPIEGVAASAMLGNGDPVLSWSSYRRRIPLVLGYDRLGRSRGSLLSMVYNYGGRYAGSAWLFSGVTSQDLFAENSPLLAQLPTLIDRLLERTFIAHAVPSEYSYRPNEVPEVNVRLVRQTTSDTEVLLQAELWDKDLQKRIQTVLQDVTLAANSDMLQQIRFSPDSLAGTRYRVRIFLKEKQSGQVIDQFDSGFVIWRGAQVLAARSRLQYQNNYLRFNGRQQYLMGANQTGILFTSPYQTPEVWDEQIGKMADNNLRIYRALHITPTANPAYRNWNDKVDISDPSEEYWRKMDALVTICASHDVVLMLDVSNSNGLLPLHQDDEFSRQGAAFLSKFSERYKPFRGMILDLRNEPHVGWHHNYHAQQLEHYTQQLLDRYGSRDAVAQAWQTELPKEAPFRLLGSIAGGWDDLRGVDQDLFIEDVFARYIQPRCNAIRQVDPNRITTLGFTGPPSLQCWQFRQVSTPMTIFGRHERPERGDRYSALKWTDMRYAGMSASFGEFQGIMFPSWRKIKTNIYDDQSYARMLQHYSLLCFGMGFSFVNKWSIQDLEESYFPHGLLYSQDHVNKLGFDTFSNMAWLLGQLSPVYHQPRVGLLVPTANLRGTRTSDVFDMVNRAQHALLMLNVPFEMVDEDLFKPENQVMDTLIAPVPMTLSDDLYQRLLAFVQRGGNLLVSGDLSYDLFRRDTQSQRLKQLCGVQRIGKRRYPDISFTPESKVQVRTAPFDWDQARPGLVLKPAGAEVLAADTAGNPILFRHEVGKGRVIYFNDLFEAAVDTVVEAGYRWFLQDQVGLKISQSAIETGIHHFTQAGANGQQYHVLCNDRGQIADYQISAASHLYHLQMAPRSMALLAVDVQGDPIAMQIKGSVCMDDRLLLRGTAETALIDRKNAVWMVAFEPGDVWISESFSGPVGCVTQMSRNLNQILQQNVPIKSLEEGCRLQLDWQSIAGPMIFKKEP